VRRNSARSAKVQLRTVCAVAGSTFRHELKETADGSRLDVAMGRGADACGVVLREAIRAGKVGLREGAAIVVHFTVEAIA